jgi:hypothetical protein
MISIDVNHIPKQIMSSCPQGKDNDCQLKIMSGIVILVMSELS